MDPRDRGLLVEAKSGDGRALERLLSQHEKQVYRFGLRMCGSEELAKEVLQETLLTAFKDLHSFRGEASLSTWLYQIARSYCQKARRRRVDEPASFTDLQSPVALAVPTPEEGPELAAHARTLGAALQAAILALPEPQREVLILRDVEGLSAEEAAAVVGIEVRALKSRLHRARAEVRRSLQALLEPVTPESDLCPELAQALACPEEADIDQATCVRIEEHLDRCPRCQGACESLKRTVSLCRRIPGDEVPRPVRVAVRQALLQLARGSSQPP